MTLAASLDELYCEQMNDSVGLSAYLKKEEQPLEKLPGEESVAGAEITYQFVFNALYRLNYTFSDPTQITVAERDSALQKFKTEFQNYVDNLSEADLAKSGSAGLVFRHKALLIWRKLHLLYLQKTISGNTRFVQ